MQAAPSLQSCVLAAQGLLLRPDLTLAAAAAFRPVLLPLAAGLAASGGVAGAPAGPAGASAAGVTLALLRLLDFAPHLER